MIEIKNRFTGAVLFTHPGSDLGDANLGGANLRGANLGGANLSRANLGGANLGGANLGDANLGGANLGGANLGGANLGGANLGDANLSRANLGGANLGDANLRDANLGGANLGGANLSRANLSRADLSRADLSGADLSGADLSGSNIHLHRIAGEGELTVYKKCREGVVTLKIPASAARVNAWGSRKCRAEFAIVMETPNNAPAHGKHDPNFLYVSGYRVTPDKWDPSPHVECSHGIHFFVTREEAEAY